MNTPPAPRVRPGAAPGSSPVEGTCTIGEAATRTGVSPDTIRYYERIGLLPAPPRSEGGYRRYSADAIARILFVRGAANFGFSLKELSGFLQARRQGRPPCRRVRAAGERLLGEMDRQLADLTRARAAMAATLSDWDARLEKGEPALLLQTLGERSDNSATPQLRNAQLTPNSQLPKRPRKQNEFSRSKVPRKT